MRHATTLSDVQPGTEPGPVVKCSSCGASMFFVKYDPDRTSPIYCSYYCLRVERDKKSEVSR